MIKELLIWAIGGLMIGAGIRMFTGCTPTSPSVQCTSTLSTWEKNMNFVDRKSNGPVYILSTGRLNYKPQAIVMADPKILAAAENGIDLDYGVRMVPQSKMTYCINSTGEKYGVLTFDIVEPDTIGVPK